MYMLYFVCVLDQTNAVESM